MVKLTIRHKIEWILQMLIFWFLVFMSLYLFIENNDLLSIIFIGLFFIMIIILKALSRKNIMLSILDVKMNCDSKVIQFLAGMICYIVASYARDRIVKKEFFFIIFFIISFIYTIWNYKNLKYYED